MKHGYIWSWKTLLLKGPTHPFSTFSHDCGRFCVLIGKLGNSKNLSGFGLAFLGHHASGPWCFCQFLGKKLVGNWRRKLSSRILMKKSHARSLNVRRLRFYSQTLVPNKLQQHRWCSESVVMDPRMFFQFFFPFCSLFYGVLVKANKKLELILEKITRISTKHQDFPLEPFSSAREILLKTCLQWLLLGAVHNTGTWTGDSEDSQDEVKTQWKFTLQGTNILLMEDILFLANMPWFFLEKRRWDKLLKIRTNVFFQNNDLFFLSVNKSASGSQNAISMDVLIWSWPVMWFGCLLSCGVPDQNRRFFSWLSFR